MTTRPGAGRQGGRATPESHQAPQQTGLQAGDPDLKQGEETLPAIYI